MTNTKEFSYTIEKHFGTVSVAGSLPLELNLVSFGTIWGNGGIRRTESTPCRRGLP